MLHRRQAIVAMVLTGLLTLLLAFPQARAQSQARYFPETGHYLQGLFRTYWETRGGLYVFGFPITEQYVRNSDGRVVQYFERARFELVGQGSAQQVQLANLGREFSSGRLFPRAPRLPDTPDRRYLPEAGYTIKFGFKTIWETRGGQEIFGLPISEELLETLEDGREYTVQYFERARFEYHPDLLPGQRVLISQLGRRLAPAQLLPPLPADAAPITPIAEGTPPPATPTATPAGTATATALPANTNARVNPSSGPRGTVFVLDAFGFQPGERVGVWLTAPDQSVSGADFQAIADNNGSIAYEGIGLRSDSSFALGVWSFNARGISSGREARGFFRITGP